MFACHVCSILVVCGVRSQLAHSSTPLPTPANQTTRLPIAHDMAVPRSRRRRNYGSTASAARPIGRCCGRSSRPTAAGLGTANGATKEVHTSAGKDKLPQHATAIALAQTTNITKIPSRKLSHRERRILRRA